MHGMHIQGARARGKGLSRGKEGAHLWAELDTQGPGEAATMAQPWPTCKETGPSCRAEMWELGEEQAAATQPPRPQAQLQLSCCALSRSLGMGAPPTIPPSGPQTQSFLMGQKTQMLLQPGVRYPPPGCLPTKLFPSP